MGSIQDTSARRNLTITLIMSKQYILIFVFINLSLANINTSRQNNATKDEDRCDTPEVCSQCAYQIGNIIEYCLTAGFLDIPPECIGAIIYGIGYCSECLCEVITADMDPNLAQDLCPICPNLDVCQDKKFE